ncbi:MAG: ATP-dependent DNA helicase [Candidatus Methanoperedens sp.]|nr:ATP-dependent DNA helicase [Candidatus Methanoperedens sp.]
MDYRELITGLKGKQKDAVEHTGGPLLILAGAGTGKTTTITAKIAYLIKEKGIDPASVLALTFSKEAAGHMKKKVENLLGGASEVHVSTFHSFCSEIIRENAEKCGVTHDFSILEDVDTAIMLHSDPGVDVKDATLFSNTISKAKDLNITIEKMNEFLGEKKQLLLELEPDERKWEHAFHENTIRLNTFHLLSDTEKKSRKQDKQDWISFIEEYSEYTRYNNLIHAWLRYEKRKKLRNAFDYGDLNKKALEFLNTYGAESLTSRYRYIIIDEFQDTNYVQFELIKLLAGTERNVTVVADPNQTIYAFRGAYTNNIQEFIKYFNIPAEDIVSLDLSFRSTNKILRVSHELIRKNYSENDMGMCIQLHNHKGEEGSNVTVSLAVDENEEARYIVEKIEECLNDGIKQSDIAVLYRTHAQGRRIRQALERRGHSVRVKDDTDFLKQPEIKTTLSYLYVLDNITNPKARGTEAWWRLVHYNHTLDTSDSIRIGEYLKRQRVSFQEAIYNHLENLGLSDNGKRAITQMKERFDRLKEKLVLDVSKIVIEVLDASGLSRRFTDEFTKEGREALMNLRNLHEMAVKFEKFQGREGKELGKFIAYLEILDEMGNNPSSARIVDDDAINLMTIHSSKGLEFRIVFLTNMAKDRFPLFRGGAEPLIPEELMEHYRDIMQQEFISKSKRLNAIRERKREIKLEEERRLCYVAMTRAGEKLFMTFASQYDGRERLPSEFLADIGIVGGEMDIASGSGDITFIVDDGIKAKDIINDSELERIKAHIKKLVVESLDSGNFEENLGHLLTYHALKEGNEIDYLDTINRNWAQLNPSEKVAEILKRNQNGEGLPVPEDIVFSVSSINTYNKCPRMYELQVVLGIPTRDMETPDSALNTGKFVHKVAEVAVKMKISTREELDDIVRSLTGEDKWKWVDTEKAKPLLDVFWARNRDRINNNLMVEKKFTVPLGEYQFKGFIDRIDLIPDREREVEIIDYKTGNEPAPDERSRQLLLYVHGFRHLFPEYTVRRLTLELLSKEKPRVYELEGDEYKGERVEPLDNNALSEMEKTAGCIIHDHRFGFRKVEDEKQCRNCGYRLYCG